MIRGPADWHAYLETRAPVFGHRNWIVVADSAYPAQSAAGIETIATYAEQLEVLRDVLDQLARLGHVAPIVHLDRELAAVDEASAPGIAAYREELGRLLAGRAVREEPHEELLGQLERAAASYRVLVLKSVMALPYASVFLELACGYWDAEAEERLRGRLAR